MPQGAVETGRGRVVGGGRRDPPAGRGGGGQEGQLLFRHRPPAAQDEDRHAGLLRRELEAPGGGEPEPRDLADHRREAPPLSPSSMTGSTSRSLKVSAWMTWSGWRPARARPGRTGHAG